MTWRFTIDPFSQLATIYDGDRFVCQEVGKSDAEMMVVAMNSMKGIVTLPFNPFPQTRINVNERFMPPIPIDPDLQKGGCG